MKLKPTDQAGKIRIADKRDLSDRFRKYIGRQVSYYTHGIHRYPAKFIPQVPRFCMERYSKPGDTILDPFMGSGTTLLEAMLMGRNSYGIDIHPLARLITKVKIAHMLPHELKDTAESLVEAIENDTDDNCEWIPIIPNFEHWFRPNVASDLATIKKHIQMLRDGPQKDFFKICFSSIIRKVSNSDNASLIPEVTTFQKKLVEQNKVDFNPIMRFENAVRLRLLDVQDLQKAVSKCRRKFKCVPTAEIIGRDAKDIELDNDSVDLGITSPPYASAIHYVSVHKLELYWLDLMDEDPDLERNIVGTMRVYANEYNSWEPGGILPEIDNLIHEITNKDRKSGYILHKYFTDMLINLKEVYRVLRRDGIYCVVVGENMLRKTKIPTYQMLDLLAEHVGFKRERIFDYDIINRHLDVPRWNKSAILQDHILVFRK